MNFKIWHKIKTAYALRGIADFEREIKRKVEESLADKNLIIEYFDPQEKKQLKRNPPTEKQIELFKGAREWARSEEGRQSIKKAIEVAKKAAQRMRDAQYPIGNRWYF